MYAQYTSKKLRTETRVHKDHIYWTTRASFRDAIVKAINSNNIWHKTSDSRDQQEDRSIVTGIIDI